MKNGIDVSKWQSNIDWVKVKSAGIEFAIIRSGWGKESPAQKDNFFEQNYAGCKAAGIHTGSYHYSYADSVNDAVLEAKFCLKNIAGKQFEYPIIFDIEDRTMLALSTQTRTDICRAFCNEIEKGGYYAMIYCNVDWYRNKLYGDDLAKRYDMWIAHWGVSQPAVSGGIWQKSSTGKINGISGDVDLNEAFKDYPTIMRSKGLNGYKADGSNVIPESTNKTYIVVKGDSLWKISEKFLGSGAKWKQIYDLNILKSETIYPGQVLKIPN